MSQHKSLPAIQSPKGLPDTLAAALKYSQVPQPPSCCCWRQKEASGGLCTWNYSAPFNTHTTIFSGSHCNVHHEQVGPLQTGIFRATWAQKKSYQKGKPAISVSLQVLHNFLRADFCNSSILYWYNVKSSRQTLSASPSHFSSRTLKGHYNPLTWIHLYKTAWRTKREQCIRCMWTLRTAPNGAQEFPYFVGDVPRETGTGKGNSFPLPF